MTHQSQFRRRTASCGLHDLGAALALAVLLCPLFPLAASAAEVIPPAPLKYFNDYAGVVPPQKAEQLNEQLETFERETSDQIVVAVYPRMQSDSSIEDYTVRVAESWKVGQKGKNNGAVLFVFIQDRKMFLQVGYGLEGALPDATAHLIIENEIKPRFRNGDYAAGLTAGVDAILKAVRGEYKGTGKTAAESGQSGGFNPTVIFFIILILIVVILSSRRGGRVYRSSGYHSWGGGGWSSGGGGWSSGGGGGFCGGGGSFGGGGAGGSW